MSANDPGTPAITDAVLDQLEVLATVEHALIVECLTVSYALGSSLDQADGGPTTDEGRDAVQAASLQALTEMRHFRNVSQMLLGAGREARMDRAGNVTSDAGTAVSLDPPSLAQLQQLAAREQVIAAAVDAQYAKLDPAIAESLFFGPPAHTTAFASMIAPLASVSPDVYLRATRRVGADSFESSLLDASDGGYDLILRVLGEQFTPTGGSVQLPENTMGLADNVNRLLVQRGLLPPFTAR